MAGELGGASRGARGRRILVVEDADELRKAYETALRSEGFDVRAVALAEVALEIVRTWRPDLVITDLFMPGMDGFDLITRLRSDLAPPVPPIVAISGFPDAKAEALSRGATRFELKPLTVVELLQLVDEAFAHARASRSRPARVLSERRAATRAIGEATLAKFLTEEPGFFDRVRGMTRMVGRFFGHSTVLVFFLQAGKLRLVASSSPAFQQDSEAADVLPIMNDVVESEGKLIVTDGASRWFSEQTGLADVRFLVAVPFVLEHAAVGALSLIDKVPHEFSSAAVGILEDITRRSAGAMKGGPRIADGSGLLEQAAFGALLHASATIAQESGHALGYAMFEVAEVPDDGSLDDMLMSLPAANLMIGVLDRHHLAAFAVADSGETVRERLKLVRRQIGSRLTVKHCVELTYDDPAPIMEPSAFEARCRELLASAVAEAHAYLAIDARRR
jgi:CheY-like chemotaxis protein